MQFWILNFAKFKKKFILKNAESLLIHKYENLQSKAKCHIPSYWNVSCIISLSSVIIITAITLARRLCIAPVFSSSLHQVLFKLVYPTESSSLPSSFSYASSIFLAAASLGKRVKLLQLGVHPNTIDRRFC